jgi:hypothetical protein
LLRGRPAFDVVNKKRIVFIIFYSRENSSDLCHIGKDIIIYSSQGGSFPTPSISLGDFIIHRGIVGVK